MFHNKNARAKRDNIGESPLMAPFVLTSENTPPAVNAAPIGSATKATRAAESVLSTAVGMHGSVNEAVGGNDSANAGVGGDKNDSSNAQPDDMRRIVAMLHTIQEQNLSILAKQENTFHWNVHHHKNLHNVVCTLKFILDTMSEHLQLDSAAAAATTAAMDLVNDRSLHNVPHASFHDRVMMYRHDGNNPQFEELIAGLDETDFSELKSASISLILPIIHMWLSSGTNEQMSLVFLIESVKRYPNLAKNNGNRDLCHGIATVLRQNMNRYAKSDWTADFDEKEVQYVYESLLA